MGREALAARLGRRRILIAAAGLLAAPVAGKAQLQARNYRVGLVFTTAPLSEMAGPNPLHPYPKAFIGSLASLGYTEGRNLTYLPRSAEGKFERLAALLKELVDLNADVIVVPGDELPRLAKALTSTVPVVMMSFSDPVELGLVASLARPGGNLTGVARSTSPEIEGKRLELLKQALPQIARVAFLGRKQDWENPFGQSARAAARALDLELIHAEHATDDYAEAFARIARERPDALLVAQNTANFGRRGRIIEFARKSRMPAMYYTHEFVQAGGLMSYGADLVDLYRRAAVFVARILKGARPADLPIERPTKFELVINLSVARALGITIAQSLMLRADRVVE